MVQNQFNKNIKTFQSDGGGEFTSLTFKSHLAKHGIRHLISCPATPQQNGLAERKHMHITELGLSMLLQSQAPQKYWTEAFFTANYIINMLPSAPLDNNSPHELLYKEPPSYDHLRVFGSACYPCLRPFTKNKLEPRSELCVFLGYHPQYKGYRCLFPPTGKVYISRNVTFDETRFPFTEIHSPSTPSQPPSNNWPKLPAPLPQIIPPTHTTTHGYQPNAATQPT